MTAPSVGRDLSHLLFGDPSRRVFAILDGASVPNLPRVLWEQKPAHVCLVKGELSPEEAAVAPWLVRLDPDSPTTSWILDTGWGRHWGVFAVTPPDVDLRRARDHLRELLLARLPDGRVVNFRFYDPRVLRTYLPTCTTGELSFVFGPFESFVLEDEDSKAAMRFRRGGNEVRDGRTLLGGNG